MERALRAVSVERGVDPGGLALVAFGGAGPLHACALAEALGMPAVIVPARAGVLSAVGLLTAPRRRDLVRSWPTPQDHACLTEALGALGKAAAGLVGPAGGDAAPPTVETAVDCRYRGQSHELTVASVGEFHDEHRRRNGYARPDEPVEVVALRAVATRPPTVAVDDLPAADRLEDEVRGPAVIAEPDCTIWVADGWTARAGAGGALVMHRGLRA
jgi:N-methylhydantoinase A/oxoprolinase/acetone carboxylase beta subunit